MQTTIRVGVYDWAHFALEGGYYPDDLPDEWRLGYYANEFETACIRLTPALLQPRKNLEWLEDLVPGFHLYFDIPSDISLDSELLPKLNTFKTVLSESAIAPPSHFLDVADRCWTPQSARASDFALLPGDAEIRMYRRWIDDWVACAMQQGRPQTLLLWLQGAQTSDTRLSEIRSLVELMGY